MTTMKKTKFYDTSSLLLKADTLFEDEDEKIVISSITLEELEHIKTAANKDADVKYAARKLVQLLDQNFGKYTVNFYIEDKAEILKNSSIFINNDAKILACALNYRNCNREEEFSFVTNDLCLKHLARAFKLKVESVEEDKDDYFGYKDIIMSDEDMVKLYDIQYKNINSFNLNINEYLIVRNKENVIVDLLCWTGEEYRHLNFTDFNSKWFGNVKPISGDTYQMFAADSFNNNKITLIKGPAGSGKTYLSLSFLINRLEKGKIDRIIIFCNTVATKDSAKLG